MIISAFYDTIIRMRYILLPVLSFVFLSVPASAQETMRELSSLKIREFVASMTDKTRPGSRLTDEEVRTYLNTHLSDHGAYNIAVTYRMPGQPDQTQQMALDKAKFIENVLSSRSAMQDYTSSIKVDDINVTGDKKSATIKTETRERGLMPINKDTYVPFKGQSNCTQDIRLNGDTPQITSANCQSVIEFIRTMGN